MRNLFNTKVKIETAEKKLSESNVWILEYVYWNDLWASIFIKDISARRALYLFVIKWRKDFPDNFRIALNGKIFMPTQLPVRDPAKDLILFHATVKQKGE
ncbi:MAG: hypothetical protein LBT67_00010 [Holosporaceae bacterium]|jgi:hypothetical protein|nr:hypothetical protein [Holosporaceae bacterium]